MKRTLSHALLFVLGTALATAPAFAAKKKPEVYSATDASSDEQPSDDNFQQPVELPSLHYRRPAPAVVKVSAAAPVVVAPVQIQAQNPSTSEPVQIQTRITGPYFDPVPSDQADAIAGRLKIVEILLRKYHRAYDYRSHTFQELTSILAELDRGNRPAPARAIEQANPPMPEPAGGQS